MDSVSGVGVLDKAMAVVGLVADRPRRLSELVEETGHSRATVHRLSQALEVHGLLRRTADGRFALGQHLVSLGRSAAHSSPLADHARPALEALRATTGESVQLYVEERGQRMCVAALDSPHELRTIVAQGTVLPLESGSAGRVLRGEGLGRPGWIETCAERAPGVASVSAPVRDHEGVVSAAVSVSGPLDRLGPSPGRLHGRAVVHAAATIAQAMGWQ